MSGTHSCGCCSASQSMSSNTSLPWCAGLTCQQQQGLECQHMRFKLALRYWAWWVVEEEAGALRAQPLQQAAAEGGALRHRRMIYPAQTQVEAEGGVGAQAGALRAQPSVAEGRALRPPSVLHASTSWLQQAAHACHGQCS